MLALNDLMRTLLFISHGCNRIINKIHAERNENSLEVVDKGKNDPQTKADRETEYYVIKNLLRRHPGIRIVGEETSSGTKFNAMEDFDEKQHLFYEEQFLKNNQKLPVESQVVAMTSSYCVWVDPLDGTREFRDNKFEYVTSLIGVTLDKKPILGIIIDLSDNCLYCGIVDAAASFSMACIPNDRGFYETKLLESFPKKSELLSSVIISRSRSDHMTSFLVLLRNTVNVNLTILQAGGAGHKMLQVFLRKADLYPYTLAKGLSYWDICACDALLRSVGGFVCNVTTGKPAEYDIENLETYEVNFGILASYDPSFIDTSIQILKNKL